MNPSTSFGKILAKHRERLGEPVTLEEILDLHDAAMGSGSLSEQERTELLDRVAADPDAARKLQALMRFPEKAAPEEAEGVEDRWAAFKAQLDTPEDYRSVNTPVEPDGSVVHFPSGAGRARFRYAALAASLVLCSFLVFWLSRDQAPETKMRINTPIVSLTTEEVVQRGAKQIDWPSNAQALVIVLSAPEISSRSPLDLVILDSEGNTIAHSSGIESDEAGLFFATLDRELIGPGLYEIQLQNNQEDVLASFPVEINSPP